MSLLDWIYPPRCMACHNLLMLTDRRAGARHICPSCEALLVPVAPPVCGRCGHPVTVPGANHSIRCASCQGKNTYFESNTAIYAYEGLLRDLMHEMKFRDKRQVAEGFGELMADACPMLGPAVADWLVPVPMHPRKERHRGFNQAEILARALGKRYGLPVVPNLLKRTRNTPPQSGLSPVRRAENMEGAFRINPRYAVSHKKILLIDDIYTTGATLDACAKILAESGAGVISCMTLSIAVQNNGKV